MSRLNITTIKDLCQPIGREGYAFDFPLDTGAIEPDDLKPLIDNKVYIQTNGDKFDFIDKTFEGQVVITDISSTKLYVKARKKSSYREELVEVDLDKITLIEWSEQIVKRITVTKGAQQR